MRRCRSLQKVCLLVVVGMLVGGFYSAAEADQREPVVKLGEIRVSAAKMDTVVEKTPTNIHVISRQELEKMPGATTVNEVLRQVPGLYVPQYQSGVANDGVYSARGAEPKTNGLRFLVNGIEFNKGNGYTVPTRVPINDIERIEIIKTPSAEYGDQAVGGVINVVTRVAQKPLEAKVGMAFGSFDYSNYLAVINGSKDRWEYYFDMSTSQSEGYQDDVFYDPNNFYTKVAYTFDDSTRLEFHGSHMDSKGAWADTLTQAQFDADHRQNPGKADPFENDYDLAALVLKKEFGDDQLVVKLTGKDEWVGMNFGLDFEFDEWELFPAVTYALRHNLGGMGNTILFGVEYRKHELETQLWRVVNGVRQNKIKDTLRDDTSWAAYIMDELAVTDALTFSFGARFDSYDQDQTGRVNPANTVSQSDDAISPKFGFTYTFNDAANLFGGYNSGFKSPARVPGAAYSPGLDPEKVQAYEIGLRGAPLAWLTYEVAGFINQYTDKWIKTGTDPSDPFTNAGETEAVGVELALGMTHDSGLYANLTYTYQESEYEDFTVAGVSYDGNRLPNVPEQLFGLLAGYQHPVWGQIAITADYVGERYFNRSNTLDGDSYWIWGASYKKVFEQWQPGLAFTLTASNLGDEETVVYGGGQPGSEKLRPVMGRRIVAGIELLF